MRAHLLIAVFCWILVCTSVGAEEKFRTWTSSTGQTMEARLLGYDAQQLQLVTREGQVLLIPRQAFSEEDHNYMASLPGLPLLQKPFVRMQTVEKRGRDVNRKIKPITSEGHVISYGESRDPESILQVSATLTPQSDCRVTLISYLAHPRDGGGVRFQKMEEKEEFLLASTPLESFILTFEEKPQSGGIASRGKTQPKPEWLVMMYWEGIYLDHKASDRAITRGKEFEKLKAAMLRAEEEEADSP